MAAQLRLSYPTAIVGQMVKRGETTLANRETNGLADEVHIFLTEHQDKFDIGMQPVEQYIAKNKLHDINPEVTKEITRIQRVLQITPSDDSMNALLKRGVDSAYAVTRYDRDEFVRIFESEVGGEANARLIHAKSQQVHNTILNLAVSYLTATSAPGLGANRSALILDPFPKGPGPEQETANAIDVVPNPTHNVGDRDPPDEAADATEDIIAYPTLEGLFGEIDYCTCEHCRSFLSPAAYLVDLLKFIDLSEKQSIELPNPLDVLLNRRPDIEHLPLTCENTNTPLPYIDLVNETLEYYITHGHSLENYTGHTTDDSATPEELLANPQFVSSTAYEILSGKPDQAGAPPPLLPPAPPLPMHQPLENLRHYFDKFEAPLPEVMEALLEKDELERPDPADPTRPVEYGWRDILMEELRLSRAEYELLTNSTLTLQQLYGYPSTTTIADALGGYLFSVGQNFVIELDKGEVSQSLRDQFEGHGTALTPPIHVEVKRTGISWIVVDANSKYCIWNKNQTLNVHLVGLSNAKAFTRRVGITYEEIIDILKTCFANPNSPLIPKLERLGVPFTTIKMLNSSPLTGQSWLDQLPKPLPDASQYGGDIRAWIKNDENYKKIMSLITLADQGDKGNVCSFENLEFRYSDPDKSTQNIRAFDFVRLIRFIRLWKKLGWTIEQTDKAIMALYPADQTPDNPDDDIADLQKLKEGFRIMLPRLGVVKRVMDALNLKPKKDLLPLLACFAPIDTHGENSLYRQMFLSPSLLEQDKAFDDDGYGNFLKGSEKVADHKEVLRAAFSLTDDELKQIIDALKYEADKPLTLDNISAIFRRGWLARKLKLSVREFLLLIQFTDINPFDPSDPVDPPILRFIELVTRLRAASLKPTQALYLIWNQDISGKSKPSDDEILSFARTLRYDFAAIESEFAIADDPNGQIAREKMALVYGNEATDHFFGLLSNSVVTDVEYEHDQETLQQEILNAASGNIAYDNLSKRLSYNAGVMPGTTLEAIYDLDDDVTQEFKEAVNNLHKKTRQFFDRYSELEGLYDAYIASTDPQSKKCSDLLASILPELKDRRKRQHALQAVSSSARTDLSFTNTLLVSEIDGKYILNAVADNGKPALDDLMGSEKSGLSEELLTSGDLTSGTLSGYLEAPENDYYNIHIEVEADEDAKVTLILGDKERKLNRKDNIWSNKEKIELRTGALYFISIKVEKVKDKPVIRWETTGRGREVIPARYLYSEILIGNLRLSYIRFLKAISLAAALKLTANEIAHIASRSDYQIGNQGWLNSLPIKESPGTDTSAKLLKALDGLLDFARMKAALSPKDERFLKVLKDPLALTENKDSPLFTLTRWDEASLDLLLFRFGKVEGGKADRSALKDLETFCRIYDGYAWAKKLGVSADALIKATTNEPDAITVRDLQSALRARFAESDWLNVIKPINDEMRALQRDALVAYILHQMRSHTDTEHIDTPEKLFEYFLMDVQMEPCMQTSRIRHALSSVQLFIERCLMNLEAKVELSPEDFRKLAKQWEWMKRYRVWEANRKVFLYPENWLEPELRDDQSPFFKEMMSELLQSDITEDRAATALLNYLSKLDEVAKLEPCGMYFEEGDPGTEDDITHVVARTAGENRKYYYRRREGGSWTPGSRSSST